MRRPCAAVVLAMALGFGGSAAAASLGISSAAPQLLVDLGTLPVGFSIHIDRSFWGDGDRQNADAFADRFLFCAAPREFDPTIAYVRMTAVHGYDTGFADLVLCLCEANASGAFTGAAADDVLTLAGITPGEIYALSMSGSLRMDNPVLRGDQSIGVGRYDIVLGLAGAVPLPPAIVFLLTALGALFGLGRMRGQP